MTRKVFAFSGKADGPAAIVAMVELVPTPPVSSFTERVTAKVPVTEYACVGIAPVPVELSPKFHE